MKEYEKGRASALKDVLDILNNMPKKRFSKGNIIKMTVLEFERDLIKKITSLPNPVLSDPRDVLKRASDTTHKNGAKT